MDQCCSKPYLCYPDPPCHLTCLNCGAEDTGDRTTEEEYRQMYLEDLTKNNNQINFMEKYISSKGEEILIKDMANPHLIHSIAKLSASIALKATQVSLEDAEIMLKALKKEAIDRLTSKVEEEKIPE